MRMTSMLAGFAVLLTACGGEKKGPEGQQATATPDQQQPAPAAGGAGKTHDVNMVQEGATGYKYVPDQLTIGPNDVIRYHNKSGLTHNVAFWEDSIPKGAASAIVLPEPIGTLSSKMAVIPDEVLEVKFNNAPKGEYKYYCTPHLMYGMKARLTVQ